MQVEQAPALPHVGDGPHQSQVSAKRERSDIELDCLCRTSSLCIRGRYGDKLARRCPSEGWVAGSLLG